MPDIESDAKQPIAPLPLPETASTKRKHPSRRLQKIGLQILANTVLLIGEAYRSYRIIKRNVDRRSNRNR